ncbi:MAG: hypothetical protein HC767_04870 [Akkermansiaceae bacterium]|nr:hypothetical protein [Akkermansiaceae bacterium]
MVPQKLQAILSDVRAACNVHGAEVAEGAEVLECSIAHTDQISDGQNLKIREVPQVAHGSRLHATAGSQIQAL